MQHLSDKALGRLQTLIEIPDFSGTRYRIVEKIGEGGMGAVFRAEDNVLHRQVALKVMDHSDRNGALSERMRREAEVIARLEHPGIVPIHDVGTLPDGQVYYAMKLVQGDRLDEYRRKHDSLPELLRIFQKICEAVAFAHAQNVIHRDLKPENIMVGAFGEVLVMDWGLAKILTESKNEKPRANSETENENDKQNDLPERRIESSQATLHGTVMGTPSYMAPEQAEGEIGKIDQRTDVFALGAMLSFLLTGEHPGSHSDAIKIPKHLTSICQKAMASEKSTRYPSALELAQDVERFLNGLAVSAYRDNPLEKIWRWLVRYKFLIFIVLIYMIVRILLFFLLRNG